MTRLIPKFESDCTASVRVKTLSWPNFVNVNFVCSLAVLSTFIWCLVISQKLLLIVSKELSLMKGWEIKLPIRPIN